MALTDLQHDQPMHDVRPDVAPTTRPRSVVPAGDGLAGLASLTLVWVLVMVLRPPTLAAVWLVLLATAAPMLWRELARAPAAARRTFRLAPLHWLVGFLLAAAPFIAIHWQGQGWWAYMIAWITVAPAFMLRFGLETWRNGAPSGGFPLALSRALFPFDRAHWRALAAPARLWSLKAFFIPLYGASLFALLRMALDLDLGSPFAWLMLAVIFAYTVDLSFGASGYLFASNDFIPTIRSTQTLLFGWVVCLVCYGPVFEHWPDFAAVVSAEISWPLLVTSDPLMLAGAAAMLALLALYVAATIRFGLRFCNLSNRGLIAGGPYRLMKHPAYFAHVGNAWIISLIFLPAAGVELGIGQWLVPLAFTLLYSLRALTEESHMREDAEYRDYAAWIAQHGLVARLSRIVGRRLA